MDIEDVHKNSKLLIDGIPYNADDVDFVKPGKGRAIYRIRLRNLRDNTVLDRTFHSGDTAEEVYITVHEEQYLYQESDNYVFMNTETFDQRFVSEELLGDKKHFLKEGTVVTVTMMGDEMIDITLPTFVELAVVGSEITTKTATITPQNKAAVLETGYTIGVPSFIKEGDIIKVDTRSGNYVERVNIRK
jgi:elongation factor P